MDRTTSLDHGDGLLVLDLDGDGVISGGEEISFAGYGGPGATDLEGLAAGFDTNHDGVFNAADARFDEFKVWQDLDGDGETDAGELKSLAEQGIASIGLTSDKSQAANVGRSRIYGVATAVRTDGRTIRVGDVGLGYVAGAGVRRAVGTEDKVEFATRALQDAATWRQAAGFAGTAGMGAGGQIGGVSVATALAAVAAGAVYTDPAAAQALAASADRPITPGSAVATPFGQVSAAADGSLSLQGRTIADLAVAPAAPVASAPHVVTAAEVTSAPADPTARPVGGGGSVRFDAPQVSSGSSTGSAASGAVASGTPAGSTAVGASASVGGIDGVATGGSAAPGGEVPVRDLPPFTLTDDAATTEDTPLVIDVARLLANDRDPEGRALTFDGLGQAIGGTVSINSVGEVVFTPTADFNGEAGFSYFVRDAAGNRTAGQVAVRVTPINDAPDVTADRFDLLEDQVAVFAPAALLGNDRDVDGDTLTISAVGGVIGGTVALNAAGEIVFTPTADFNGAAGFDYTVSDGHGGMTTGHVSVGIAPVNDAPALLAETVAGSEDQPLRIATDLLLANDRDVDGDVLTLDWVGEATHGQVRLGEDGVIEFVPDANYNGQASFTYRVVDGQGGVATAVATVIVAAVNDAPVVQGEVVGAFEDIPVVLSFAQLLANDRDMDGDALTIVGVRALGGGAVSLGNGQVIFTPAANYSGAAAFDYLVSDGNGGTVWSTVGLAVQPVNDAPVIVDHLAVDTAGLHTTGGQFVVTDVDAAPGELSFALVGPQPWQGAVTVNNDGTWFYDAWVADGSLVEFSVRVSDAHGAEAVASVSFYAGPIGPPVDPGPGGGVDGTGPGPGTGDGSGDGGAGDGGRYAESGFVAGTDETGDLAASEPAAGEAEVSIAAQANLLAQALAAFDVPVALEEPGFDTAAVATPFALVDPAIADADPARA